MSDKVVFLAFKSENTEADGIDFISCKHCRNKTFSLTEDSSSQYPMAKCAACGAHIGRIGWVNE